jgi:rod shape determining protein RodA
MGGYIMGIGDNSKINDYIDYVCSYVKFKEAHKEIKEELSGHIKDAIYEYTESGMTSGESVDKAVQRMGDGEAVGKQLNIAHKGTPDWIILILTIVLVNTGVALMYLIQYKSSSRSMDYLFNHSLLYAAVGTIGIVLLYFFDYKKLQKYSNHIFLGMCLLFVLSFFIGNQINGRNLISLGSFTFDVKAISLYVFVIALAGIFNSYDWNKRVNLIKATGYLVVPMVLMVAAHGLSYCGIYFIAFIVVALKSKMKKIYAIYIVSFNAICFLLYSFNAPYRIARLFSFVYPFSDPEGNSYLNVQMYKITHTAGVFGNGFSANEKLLQLPEMQSDFIFNYILHTFGWLGAAIIITIFISFVYRILHITKYVRDNYGMLLIAGLLSIFIVQFGANILMNVNLFPVISMALPFISYGGTLSIINMLSVGVIMSVYRRKSLSI